MSPVNKTTSTPASDLLKKLTHDLEKKNQPDTLTPNPLPVSGDHFQYGPGHPTPLRIPTQGELGGGGGGTSTPTPVTPNPRAVALAQVKAALKKAGGPRVGIQNDGTMPTDHPEYGSIARAKVDPKGNLSAQIWHANGTKSTVKSLVQYERQAQLGVVSNSTHDSMMAKLKAAAASGATAYRTEMTADTLPPKSVAEAYQAFSAQIDSQRAAGTLTDNAQPTIDGFKAWLKTAKPGAVSKADLADANAQVQLAQETPEARKALDASLVSCASSLGEYQAFKDFNKGAQPPKIAIDLVMGLGDADVRLRQQDGAKRGVGQPGNWTLPSSGSQGGVWLSKAAQAYAQRLTGQCVFLANVAARSGVTRAEMGNELNHPDEAGMGDGNFYSRSPAVDSMKNVAHRLGWLEGTIYKAIKSDPDPATRSLKVDSTSMMFTHFRGLPSMPANLNSADAAMWRTYVRGLATFPDPGKGKPADPRREAVVDAMWNLHSKYTPSDVTDGHFDGAGFLQAMYDEQKKDGLLSTTGTLATDETNMHFYGTPTEDASLIKLYGAMRAQGVLPSDAVITEIGSRNTSAADQSTDIYNQITNVLGDLAGQGFKIHTVNVFGEHGTLPDKTPTEEWKLRDPKFFTDL